MLSPFRKITSPINQGGASLIEVMVAALIMGIGLLGILSLQGRALQFNHQSYLFSQASILAQDMAERMSSNASAIDDYRGNPSSAGVDCNLNSCSNNQLAAWDKFHWQEAVKNTLPQGEGSVVLSANGEAYIISVEFNAERDSANNDLESVRLVVSSQ